MWLAAIATGSLLAAGSFPKQRPDWDSLTHSNNTWDAWKTTFRSHQLTLERKQRAAGERRDVFSSAATAIPIHGITATTANPGALLTPDTLAHHAASADANKPAGEFALQALDGHLNWMADAAMNSDLTLQQLTNANAHITSNTTKKYDAIKKVLSELKLVSASPGTGSTALQPDLPQPDSHHQNPPSGCQKPLGHR